MQKVIQEEKDGKIKIGSYEAETILRFIGYKLNISDFDAKTLFDLFYEKSQKPLQKGGKKLSLFDLFDYISRQNEKRFSVLGFEGSKNNDH